MQRFYQSWNDAVMAGNALLGAGAFVALLGGNQAWLATILTGIIAGGSALDSVLSPGKKAAVHAQLGHRFTSIAASIAASEPTPDVLRKLTAERLMVDADEPPPRRLVDLAAHNEECRSRGIPEKDQLPLTWAQRHLGYLADFGIEKTFSPPTRL